MNRILPILALLFLNLGCGISQDNQALEEEVEMEEAPSFMDQEVEMEEEVMPTFMDQEVERPPIEQSWEGVDEKYNEERHIYFAQKNHGITISKIYYGHNVTGVTAIIVEVEKKETEANLVAMQEKINQVFPNYRQAVLQTIVNYKGEPYAIIRAKKHYAEPWISVYFYKDIEKPLQQKVAAFKTYLETSEKLEGHELVNIYYPLYLFPQNKDNFPSSLIVYTKKGDDYFRFNHYEKPGKLWTYTLNNERYYSTDSRSDPQVQIILDNGDLVNISLYYFEETAERYGSYFLKLD